MQKTLSQIATISGIGLHKAGAATIHIHPAGVNHGIVFRRTDITGRDNMIPARWDHVVDTRLCTVIGNKDGVTVSTIEHVMAALRAAGIDNALIDIDNAEMPIMDGSAEPFLKAIDEVGVVEQSAPRRAIKILKKIEVKQGGKTVSLSPSSVPSYAGELQYSDSVIGTQRFEMQLINGNFRHDVADCRTFCLKRDVEQMQANGLALGGSFENAVVIDDNGVMNPDGLRVDNEMVRHKLLDAVGDLALAGGLIIGAYEGIRMGHEMNNLLLHALFADDTAWAYQDLFINFEDEHQLSVPAVASPVAARA